jgi:hypothetical protein
VGGGVVGHVALLLDTCADLVPGLIPERTGRGRGDPAGTGRREDAQTPGHQAPRGKELDIGIGRAYYVE